MNDDHGKKFDQVAEPVDFAAVIDRYANALSPRRGNGALEPVRTGFPGFDGHIGGLHPGELTVLAARPGTGKTSLALQIALNAARLGSDVIYFSLMRSARQLGSILLSQSSGIPFEALSQNASEADKAAVETDKLETAADELEKLSMRAYDNPGTSLPEIEAMMDAHSRCPGGALCVVDNLQLVKPSVEQSASSRASSTGCTGDDRRAHETECVVLGLKMMAETLRIPVLALYTLPRVVVPFSRRRPRVDDFQNPSVVLGADTLLLLDRSLSPEEATNESRPSEAEAVVIIAKNEHGTRRDHRLAFDEECLAFSELPDAVGSVS